LFRLLSAFDVCALLGFFQFVSQLRESPPVCGFGLVVEHLARITQIADVDPRLFEILRPARQAECRQTGFITIALACDSTRQIEHVEFGRRVAQQMSEVPHAFSIS
jgi:hypothetical protein